MYILKNKIDVLPMVTHATLGPFFLYAFIYRIELPLPGSLIYRHLDHPG